MNDNKEIDVKKDAGTGLRLLAFVLMGILLTLVTGGIVLYLVGIEFEKKLVEMSGKLTAVKPGSYQVFVLNQPYQTKDRTDYFWLVDTEGRVFYFPELLRVGTCKFDLKNPPQMVEITGDTSAICRWTYISSAGDAPAVKPQEGFPMYPNAL